MLSVTASPVERYIIIFSFLPKIVRICYSGFLFENDRGRVQTSLNNKHYVIGESGGVSGTAGSRNSDEVMGLRIPVHLLVLLLFMVNFILKTSSAQKLR